MMTKKIIEEMLDGLGVDYFILINPKNDIESPYFLGDGDPIVIAALLATLMEQQDVVKKTIDMATTALNILSSKRTIN